MKTNGALIHEFNIIQFRILRLSNIYSGKILPLKWKRLYNTGLCEIYHRPSLRSASCLLDVDELREVLDIREHGILLHPQLVPGDQEADQLLVEGLDLGQVVVLN